MKMMIGEFQIGDLVRIKLVRDGIYGFVKSISGENLDIIPIYITYNDHRPGHDFVSVKLNQAIPKGISTGDISYKIDSENVFSVSPTNIQIIGRRGSESTQLIEEGDRLTINEVGENLGRDVFIYKVIPGIEDNRVDILFGIVGTEENRNIIVLTSNMIIKPSNLNNMTLSDMMATDINDVTRYISNMLTQLHSLEASLRQSDCITLTDNNIACINHNIQSFYSSVKELESRCKSIQHCPYCNRTYISTQ